MISGDSFWRLWRLNPQTLPIAASDCSSDCFFAGLHNPGHTPAFLRRKGMSLHFLLHIECYAGSGTSIWVKRRNSQGTQAKQKTAVVVAQVLERNAGQ